MPLSVIREELLPEGIGVVTHNIFLVISRVKNKETCKEEGLVTSLAKGKTWEWIPV
jgi:hypothetical protein